MRRLTALAGAIVAVGVLAGMGQRAQREFDADALLRRAEASLTAKDFAAARRDFQQAVRLLPRDERALNGLSRSFERRGDFAAAIAVQETLLASARRESWPLEGLAVERRNIALLYYQSGQLDRAAAAFADLHQSGAAWLEPDLLLAITQLRRGDWAAARALQPQLVARYGDIEPLWKLALATAAVAGGAHPSRAALEVFTSLRAAPPELAATRQLLGPGFESDPIALAVFAEAAFVAEDAATARAAWSRLLGGPLDGAARMGLGRLALRIDTPEAALELFEAARLDSRVPHELVGFWCGQALQVLGRLEPARLALLQAVDANPLALRGEALLGVVEAQSGDLEAAAAAFGRVLEVDPKHPEALYRLGAMWFAGARRTDGLQLLQRYLAAHPDGRYAPSVRQLVAG